MGLDMYLYKRRYHGFNYEHVRKNKELPDLSSINVDVAKLVETIEDGIYWRKANAIHKWFVDNVQDGNDDCGHYYVSRDQLEELYETCKSILLIVPTAKGQISSGQKWDSENNHWSNILEDRKVVLNSEQVANLLPTQEGFFFGSTDYDNYYLEDIQYTFDQLNRLLKEDSDIDYEYHSSW